jgi:hypothetical protein
MNPHSHKNKKLLKQFPFLYSCMHWGMVPASPTSDPDKIDDLTISVQVADHDLMYLMLESVGIDGRGVTIFSPTRKGQRGVSHDHMFALDCDGVKVRTAEPKTFVHEMFTGWLKDLLTIEYLVFVRITVWHKSAGEHGLENGDFVARTVEVIVYQKPKLGKSFYDLFQESSYETNLVLCDRVIGSCMFVDRYKEKIHHIMGMLSELCIQFEEGVVKNGMQQIIQKSGSDWLEGEYAGIEVLFGDQIGRPRIQLNDKNGNYVVFGINNNVSDKNWRMNIAGELGKLPNIRRMIIAVIDTWKQFPESHQNFKVKQPK